MSTTDDGTERSQSVGPDGVCVGSETLRNECRPSTSEPGRAASVSFKYGKLLCRQASGKGYVSVDDATMAPVTDARFAA